MRSYNMIDKMIPSYSRLEIIQGIQDQGHE